MAVVYLKLMPKMFSRRRDRGVPPFTVMSCDNIQGNGEVAQRAFTTFARAKDADLAAWIETEVAFPSSMVDRITPVTTDADRALVAERFGVDDAWPVVAEPFEQWATRVALWLNSAKGGDPMSHGPAERSAISVARHYR